MSIAFHPRQQVGSKKKKFNFTACWESSSKKYSPENYSENFFFLCSIFHPFKWTNCGMWLACRHRRLSILLHFKYFSLLSCFSFFFKGLIFFFKLRFCRSWKWKVFSFWLSADMFFGVERCDVHCGCFQHGKWR